jgi:glycosyltransferase involved in cell wall biosynthesis
MTHLFINGLAASAGGGLTYLRNVVPHLSRREGMKTTIAVSPELAEEFANLPGVFVQKTEVCGGAARRFYHEQIGLPGVIAGSGAQVLLSAGNFALRNSPVPQLLLSRNSLYLSAYFYRDLLSRRELGLWLDTRLKGMLARRSIRWADCTLAPSESFARQLESWSGRPVFALYHGFDPQQFVTGSWSLPAGIEQKLQASSGRPRLLFVSHYNYYRNFETLIRAVALLRGRSTTANVQLVLTCLLDAQQDSGGYRVHRTGALIRELNIADHVVELGTVPYHSLYSLYRACDIYVTPAYAESFAHPLVEAMSSGLPIIASDIPVHREICRDAALYFPHTSPQELADAVTHIVQSPEIAGTLSEKGTERSGQFSWKSHVTCLVAIAESLADGKALPNLNSVPNACGAPTLV